MYKSINKILRAADSDYIWSKAAQQNSLHALPRDWPWDMARDRGIQGTRSLTAIDTNFQCPFCGLVPLHLQPMYQSALDQLFSMGSKLKRLHVLSEGFSVISVP